MSDNFTPCCTLGVDQQVEDGGLLLDLDDAEQALQVNAWTGIFLEVVLDSGASEHVMDSDDAPGYVVAKSPGSRRGHGFVVGSGARVSNEGQVQLNLEMGAADGTVRDLALTFQIAEINRPLMSVSKICDARLTCSFTGKGADVPNPRGCCLPLRTARRFIRLEDEADSS